MKTDLRTAALVILLGLDGEPMPESALLSAMQSACRHLKPALGDAADALADCESGGYVARATDEFTRTRTVTLTDKGIHQARKTR